MKTCEWHKETIEEILILGKIKDELLEWDSGLTALKEVKKYFDHFDATVSIGNSKRGQIHGLLLGLHSLKAKCDFDDVIKYMEEKGFKISGEPDDYPEIQRHTIPMKLGKIPIRVSGFFVGGSCEFVQVGVEEKPIYKLECKNQVV